MSVDDNAPAHDAAAIAEIELLPCPFCGGDELSYGSSYPGYGHDLHGIVQCHTCDAYMLGGEEYDAVAAWNTRAHISQAKGE